MGEGNLPNQIIKELIFITIDVLLLFQIFKLILPNNVKTIAFDLYKSLKRIVKSNVTKCSAFAGKITRYNDFETS